MKKRVIVIVVITILVSLTMVSFTVSGIRTMSARTTKQIALSEAKAEEIEQTHKVIQNLMNVMDRLNVELRGLENVRATETDKGE